MKKILILGTGFAQADAIRAIHDRGEYVVACSNKSGDAGESYADEFVQIDIVDKDAVYEYVVGNGIECIYSVGSDVAMPTVASVAKRAGLKSFVSEDTAQVCNTKYLLRARLGDDFVGNLRYQEMSCLEEPLRVDFPCVVKPSDSQGQRGVFRVDDMAQLEKVFELSKSYSRTGSVIVEEYVSGSEISVNTFSYDGQIVFALMSDRIVWDEYPGGIIHKHLIPSRYEVDLDVKRAVWRLVESVQNKLGILNGPAYFQIKVSPDGEPKLIEVTPRLDGCHMWRLIKYSTGVDLLSKTIDLLFYNRFDPVDDYSVVPYETEFFCAPPSSLFLKSSYDASDAEFIQWYYLDGDTVRKMNGYMEKCGYRIRAL